MSTDQAYTLALHFTSKNVSNVYRISLKSNWEVLGPLDPGEPKGIEWVAKRSFHSPSGISQGQTLRFCFVPPSADAIFFLNGIRNDWTIMEGLATVPITVMIGSIHRVEIHWRGEALETPRHPGHFAAWLEILQET